MKKIYLILFFLFYLSFINTTNTLESNVRFSITESDSNQASGALEIVKELLTGSANRELMLFRIYLLLKCIVELKKMFSGDANIRFNAKCMIFLELLKSRLFYRFSINKLINNRYTTSFTLGGGLPYSGSIIFSNIPYLRIIGFLIIKFFSLHPYNNKLDEYYLNKCRQLYLYFKYKQMIKPGEIDTEEDCPICLYSNDNHSVTLLCDHQFHEDCIKPWFLKKFSCPVCRQETNT